jgi:hypothetical protein
MSTESLPPKAPEKYKRLILVLIMLNTLLAAIVTFLQTDASIRSGQANIDSQYYSLLASGELIRQSIQGTYDMATYGEVLKNTQESLVYQYTSLDEAGKGNTAASDQAALLAEVQIARAAQAQKLSVFFTDPRYAPSSADQPPDLQAYLDDQNALAESLVEKQNAASDEYHLWSQKSDAYVSILTILAIAFFLLGLGQSMSSRIRLIFASMGLLILSIGGVWCLLTFLG